MKEHDNILIPFWNDFFDHITAGFTLPFFGNQALTRSSLSSGRTTAENRQLLYDQLCFDSSRVFSPHQVHSNKVLFVNDENAGRGAFGLENAVDGDACVASDNNLLLITTWADCIPVLLFDSSTNMIASIHSGWRGTKDNIVKGTVDFFKKKSGQLNNIYAAVGPGIRNCCYEVGAEFNSIFGKGELSSFISNNNERFYLDLAGSVSRQLLNEGIKEENIDFYGKCTCCTKEPQFFSCRKDKEKFEAQAAFIGLK